ncbi:hypothetical protein JXB02_03775 [Candidatus Woesearchaeota archaeon]|nr:hypothetical protein [Candidatus Woesearchaeota archaeon]
MRHPRSRYLERLILLWTALNLLSLPLGLAGEHAGKSVSSQVTPTLDAGPFSAVVPVTLNRYGQEPATITTDASGGLLMLYLALIAAGLVMAVRQPASRAGQISVFLLIGIIIIAAFSSVFYLSQYLTKRKFDTEISRMIEDSLHASAFEKYVQWCVQEATERGLLLIGMQGGVIYADQGGFMQPDRTVPFMVYNETYRVALGISEPSYTNYPPLPPMAAPGYPLDLPLLTIPEIPPFFTQSGDDFSDGHYKSYYGWRTMPNLCDKYGPNQYNPKMPRLSCEDTTYHNINTIQQQLNHYISSQVGVCSNFTAFAEAFGYNVTKGNISTSVILGLDDVQVRVTYPIVISVAGKEPITQFIKFEENPKIRLKRIYNLANAVAKRDVRDIEFNLSSDFIDVPDCRFYTSVGESRNCYRTYFDIRRYDRLEVCPGCAGDTGHADIFQITDTETFLYGKPYIFQFAVENRIPALDPIWEDTINNTIWDILVYEGDTIQIQPFGYDPDEDGLVYNYSGWKETYDETFVQNLPGCSAFTPSNCILRNDSAQPHNWILSGPYVTPSYPCNGSDGYRRCAEYTTTAADVGYHELNVSVCDHEGLCDWQVVRIMVDDIPYSEPQGSNYFSDILDTDASIEDPYLLDATGSTDFFLANLTFNWYDNLEPFNITTPFSQLVLPETISILTITDWPNYFTELGSHQVNLTLTDKLGLVDTQALDIMVHQCLPHRYPGSAPYPFNNLTFDDILYPENVGDPFQADHTCCQDDLDPAPFTYFDNTTPCYSAVFYGGNKSYETFFPLSLEPGVTHTIEYPNITSGQITAFDAQNDIYEFDFRRNCPGDRGNACIGPANETRTVIEECNDLNTTRGDTQRCQGPCAAEADDPSCALTNNSSALSCQNFTAGQTFEFTYLGDPSTPYVNNNIIPTFTRSDGICNPLLRCSSGIGPGRYAAGGDYLLIGQCSAGDCTYGRDVGGLSSCSSLLGRQIPNARPPWTTNNTPTVCVERHDSCNGTNSTRPTSAPTSNNACTSYEYACATSGNPAADDWCNRSEITNLDANITYRSACESSCSLSWTDAGEVVGEYTVAEVGNHAQECCGDDSGELPRWCVALSGTNVLGCSGGSLCCNDATDCPNTYWRNCTSATQCAETSAGQYSYCLANGTWQDMDTSQALCETVSPGCGGFHWLTDYWAGTIRCCGDDGVNDDYCIALGSDMCLDGVSTGTWDADAGQAECNCRNTNGEADNGQADVCNYAGEEDCWIPLATTLDNVLYGGGSDCCEAGDTFCYAGEGVCDSGVFSNVGDATQNTCDCRNSNRTGEACDSPGEQSCWFIDLLNNGQCCDGTDYLCASGGGACVNGRFYSNPDAARYVCENCSSQRWAPSGHQSHLTQAGLWEMPNGFANPSCCGDESNELYVTNTSIYNTNPLYPMYGPGRCCDASMFSNPNTICIDFDGNCRGEWGHEVTCNDGQDNDCDGLYDCMDPNCSLQACTVGVSFGNCQREFHEQQYVCVTQANSCAFNDSGTLEYRPASYRECWEDNSSRKTCHLDGFWEANYSCWNTNCNPGEGSPLCGFVNSTNAVCNPGPLNTDGCGYSTCYDCGPHQSAYNYALPSGSQFFCGTVCNAACQDGFQCDDNGDCADVCNNPNVLEIMGCNSSCMCEATPFVCDSWTVELYTSAHECGGTGNSYRYCCNYDAGAYTWERFNNLNEDTSAECSDGYDNDCDSDAFGFNSTDCNDSSCWSQWTTDDTLCCQNPSTCRNAGLYNYSCPADHQCDCVGMDPLGTFTNFATIETCIEAGASIFGKTFVWDVTAAGDYEFSADFEHPNPAYDCTSLTYITIPGVGTVSDGNSIFTVSAGSYVGTIYNSRPYDCPLSVIIS